MDMPNLKKYMKKKGIEEDMGETKVPQHAMAPKAQFEPTEVEGHDGISTDAFETPDTDNDPLEDENEMGPDSTEGMSALQRYQKLKAKG